MTKSFLFQFVNRYLALFIMAFVLPFPEVRWLFGACRCLEWQPPTRYTYMWNNSIPCTEDHVYPDVIDGCECSRRDCIGMTGELMLSIFMVNLFVQNAMEILLPIATSKMKLYMEGL